MTCDEKRILHIGIGNSGLARRFNRQVREIVGTTIDDPELRVAQSLGFPNYLFVLHNKYSGANGCVPGRFDFILDNNPTSPCCCIRHLAALFDFYVEKLADDGQIVTDREGLEWIPEDGNARWGFDFADLAAVAAAVGLQSYRMNRSVYVLSRSRPRPADLASLTRHIGRRALSLPGKVARHGPRAIARICRRALRISLQAAVPWALPERYRPGKKL